MHIYTYMHTRMHSWTLSNWYSKTHIRMHTHALSFSFSLSLSLSPKPDMRHQVHINTFYKFTFCAWMRMHTHTYTLTLSKTWHAHSSTHKNNLQIYIPKYTCAYMCIRTHTRNAVIHAIQSCSRLSQTPRFPGEGEFPFNHVCTTCKTPFSNGNKRGQLSVQLRLYNA
jgi:hypothetical protein